ncbi:MBL fold metallo-hydrolase [Acidaminobacter sp. JC074]|uniref:MBL fold metallo-hydrolase n=1 Tax=Acidaminobacter sp. JC074 TaxID=2530199 RepID=UPI001F10C2E2|nr:MBL fold metallo-hydrolase [Acidaminobacter sp. JC074]MCH4888196.1 MBL fold metallo-hydrolase [Acidaminobacter sp. JC074]
MNNFRIKHIFHSGFHIEYKEKILLFDVCHHLDQYENEEIICFVTHSHSDHYNPDILKLKENNDVIFVVSEDVPLEASDDVIKVTKGDQAFVKGFDVKVFGTTDLGVSYLVKIGEESIFHSGDLNWWHWENDDYRKQQEEQELYEREISELVGHPVDFAFVPVDHRLKTFHRLSMDYFIDKIGPKYLIPMHFGNEYQSIQHLKTKSKTKLIKSEYPNSYIF